ncbi:MAG: hypothetical protein R2739_02155 [Chitinophagales bacterium]
MKHIKSFVVLSSIIIATILLTVACNNNKHCKADEKCTSTCCTEKGKCCDDCNDKCTADDKCCDKCEVGKKEKKSCCEKDAKSSENSTTTDSSTIQ